MPQVVECAMAVTEKMSRRSYSITDVHLEYALEQYGDTFHETLGDIDQEGVLDEVRKVAGVDWQKVLELVIFWNIESKMQDGYFLS